MDGYCMGIYFSLPHETKWAVEAVPTSDDKMRPFVFADIRTTGAVPSSPNHSTVLRITPPGRPDEDTALGDTRVSPDNMGTTCVQVFLAKSWQRCNDGSSSSYKIQDHPPVTMNERTKKVLEHCVSYVHILSDGPKPILRWHTASETSNHPNPQITTLSTTLKNLI